MDNQNLQFNILPFEWPEEEVTFYFHREEQPKYYKLGKRLFPRGLDHIFPGIEGEGQTFVATSFDRPTEGFVPVDIDLQHDNPELAKRYFNYKVHRYFENLDGMVVRRGFAKGTQVWVPAFRNHTKELLAFECFRLRVQLATVSQLPELLIRYEREVKVCRQSVAQLIQVVPPALFDWLLVGARLVKYDDYVKEGDTDFEKALPVLNKAIRKVLGVPEPVSCEGNPYQKHFRYINGFYSRFLDNDDFREVIPIHQEFLRVNPELMRCLPYTVQEQPFEVGPASKAGLPHLKPYQKSPHPKIHLFFVVHRNDAKLIDTVKQYFFKGVGQFKGLSKFAQLHLHPQKEIDIILEDLPDTIMEFRNHFGKCCHLMAPGVTYMAIYISPYSRHDPDPKKRAVYYQVKQELLFRKIRVQALEAEKLYDPKVAYERLLPCISVAMLAKLGGIPWRMRVPVQNELVAGIGTFRGKGHGEDYTAIGLSFGNEGRFHGFNSFRAQELKMMAGFITYGVRKYSEQYEYPKRLVIHMNRKYGNGDLVLLERILGELDFPKPLPIFFVSMYGPASEGLLAFDANWREHMPYSGTIVKVGVQQYLLFNNMRYRGGCFEVEEGCDARGDFSLPIKVGIDCTDKELLQDEKGVLELLDQVHQFSRMNWRGLRQQGLPVTVRYPEMLARMVADYPAAEHLVMRGKEMWFL